MRRLLAIIIAAGFAMPDSMPLAQTFTGTLPADVEPPIGGGGREPAAVGGAPVHDHKIVGIVFDARGKANRVCSGLYISARRILTAAHCACDATNIRVSNTDYAVNAFMSAEVISIFAGYDCNNPRYIPRGDDLALLSIPTGLKDGSFEKKKTCPGYTLLPQIKAVAKFFPNPPINISAAGYGFNGISIGRREEILTSLNSILCGSRIARSMTCSAFREFIAGNVPIHGTARDTCGGDSGGPAYYREGETILPFGIVSRALPLKHRYSEASCGSGGIYTHLGRSDVIAWLLANGVPEEGFSCEPTE